MSTKNQSLDKDKLSGSIDVDADKEQSQERHQEKKKDQKQDQKQEQDLDQDQDQVSEKSQDDEFGSSSEDKDDSLGSDLYIPPNVRSETVKFGLSPQELEKELTIDRAQSLVKGMSENEIMDFYLEKTLSHSPSDVALMMKFLYFKEIRFDGRWWYRFKIHKWRRLERNPLELIARNDMVNHYLDLANRYNRSVGKYTMESEKYLGLNPREKPMYYPLVINDCIYKSKLCSELCLKLNNHSYHQKVLSCGEQCFYDKDFNVKLDVNPYAIGFNNGNWDLREGKLGLGTESDRISMSVGYDYLENSRGFSTEIEAFFHNLGLEDLIPIMASMLSGVRRQPVVWIKGLDRQGCEMISQLLLWTLGDYLGSLPFWMLRKRKIKYNEAQMELVDNCRKRICLVVQEEDDYPSVNPQMIDILLCENSFDLRKPREEYNTYVPQFGLIVMSTKKECEPLTGCYLLEAKEVTGKIKIKEEWRLDLMKLLLDKYHH